MKANLIDAAIISLVRYGYGKTTLKKITEIAGVSRGAFLHHFPTRTSILLAVVEVCSKLQNDHVRKFLATKESNEEIFRDITIATWDSMQQPYSVAYMEVMLGARSDPDLEQQYQEAVQGLIEEQNRDVWRIAQSVGIEDKRLVENMVQLHRAAMRGMLLELNHTRDRQMADDCIDLLCKYKELLLNDLLANRANSNKSND